MEKLEKEAKHEQIVEHIKKKQPDKALNLCLELLNDDHDDPQALFQLAKVLMDQNNTGLAYNLMSRAIKYRPDIPEMWIQYGQAHGESPEEWKKGIWCFRKALKLAEKQGKPLPAAHSMLGVSHYLLRDYDAALRHLETALEIKPDLHHALTSKSMVHLARHEWDKAWPLYDMMLQMRGREQYSYGDEPEWDGTPGKRLIISAEQGIGDEIMYASCIQECIDQNEHVVIECMPRLEGLFKRSFPGAAAVYGTRWDKHVIWGEDHKPDAHVAMASLPRFYRQSDEDFPGGPYLKADPDIMDAVQGIFRELGPNPKVGIAWTGGIHRTRGHLRTRTLDELTPLLRIPGIDWVSLEYHNRDEDIGAYYQQRKIPIHTYHWLTAKGLDYDLTAGLISQLDLVISVPTTAVQMAGALGIETWCMVPRYTGWMFAQDTYPWASSVVPLRNPGAKGLEARMLKWLKDRQTAAA